MDEDSFGDFKCPYCGGSISFPETDIGTAGDCPMCMQSVIVPEKGIEIAGKLPLPIQTPRLLLRRLNQMTGKTCWSSCPMKRCFNTSIGLRSMKKGSPRGWRRTGTRV